METITVPANKSSIDFSEARRLAVNRASESLNEPVIVAWKDDQTSKYGPEIPGGSAERWHQYADSHEGKLELKVGDAFHFIFVESAGFEEPDLNLTSVSEENGTTFLCLTDACTEQDKQNLGYFPGGGMGG